MTCLITDRHLIAEFHLSNLHQIPKDFQITDVQFIDNFSWSYTQTPMNISLLHYKIPFSIAKHNRNYIHQWFLNHMLIPICLHCFMTILLSKKEKELVHLPFAQYSFLVYSEEELEEKQGREK